MLVIAQAQPCAPVDEFLQDTDRLVPSKAQTPTALDAWRVWGQHAGLSVQQQELCLGPKLSVRVFERATVRQCHAGVH